MVAIGPSIENGFYYDFDRTTSFTPNDLAKIEQRMKEIVGRDEKIVGEEISKEQALKMFADMGEKFKVELINDLPDGEKITIFRQGNFVDLCRGPHLASTKEVGKNFKLMKLAGAYWRGDSTRPQLQRIYGTAWSTKDELNAYLTMLEEAEKRDHRKLGKDMDLFHFEEVAPGDVFWHPRGFKLYLNMIDYMRKRQEQSGYIEINTPQIMDKVLWETSGHWDWYKENMFTTEIEERTFAVKPMNCPGGLLYYKQGIVSYKDLPLKVAEFGKVHRFEASGALHGLLRVRSFTQDDAHIFCTPEQFEEECQTVVKLMLDIYKCFDLGEVEIYLSTRPEKKIGDDALWDRLEDGLADALTHMGFKYTVNEGDGAFYGPKLDFKVKDAIGRKWQLGTLQADLNLPERFNISYIGDDGAKHRPIMLHRALFGSVERFLGAYLEMCMGRLPLWIAPVQVVVASITSDVDDYAKEVVETLRQNGIRAEIDLRNEKISYKVREHSAKKIPMIMAVGKKEAEQKTVAIRRIGSDKQEFIGFSEALEALKIEAKLPNVKY
ncbi:MAG: Threonine--tRNA ligase 2 [Alphaproteobacteria bacterium ADurb.Bin438]|nr:MAG: Threonine--tRNA ligase 2 [Alphaproteobacteria bacterium ADurb.Bin438]